MSGFLAGYRRSPEMTEALGAAVVAALREHPTLRLGQLLCTAAQDDRVSLFNVYDEQINQGLRDLLENVPDAYGCLHGEIANGGCALVATVGRTPDSVELASLLHDYAELGKTLASALEFLRSFDRWTRQDTEDGYEGSPFCTAVRAYLQEAEQR